MLEKRKFRYKSIIWIYGIVILTIMIVIWMIYINQRNTLIALRSDEMISIAKISANNLKTYFDEKIDYLNGVFQIDDNLLEQGIDVEDYIENKILYINENNSDYEGKLSYIPYELFDKYNINKDELKECEIGPVVFTKENNYVIQIIKPIFSKYKIQGAVLVEYLLDEVYKETLGEIQVGEYGYCTLKDRSGAILMHGDKKQIGLDSLKDRQEKYPQLDPAGIDRLVTNQLSGKTGSDIVKSYWWGEDEIKQVKKIIGYAPVDIGEHRWVISAITSYDEIARPLDKIFYFIVGLGIILLVLIVSFIVFIIKMKNQQEKIILELKYSEEINKTTNMLRKHEEKLSKINSIHTLGMMASTIAHEFKNLLTPIFIYNELLMNSLKDNNEAIDDLKEIKLAADNCLELSKNILMYSKEGGEETTEWFNSTEEIKKILNILKTIVPPNIQIDNLILDKSIYIYGNRRELKQIILNICTNAYQAMESSGGVIQVKYYLEDNKAILIVNDNGEGIEDEAKNKIFEPLYTSKGNNGNGLGLSIVVELLKKINGTIQIESTRGLGTTVKIEFYNIKSDNS